MLLDETGPLIMTSANLSDLPIIIRDDEMFALADKEPLLSGVLYNRRRISVGVDDTVIRVIDGQAQLIRRSKGWTPTPVFVQGADSLGKDDQILAVGGQLKSAFCFSKGSFSYMSQYLGDLDSVESENVYQSNFQRMKRFFDVHPNLVVYDSHPRYYTTQFAKAFGAANMKRISVQHHHAHIASVMAEHGLQGPVIGISFDGTGYGADGAVWGGEVLICEGERFDRYSHLRYVNMIGGDSSMKEGWKSAVCHAHAWALAHGGDANDAGNANDANNEGDANDVNNEGAGVQKRVVPEFEVDISGLIAYCQRNDTLSAYETDGRRAAAEAALRNGINIVQTSSMGRLFDAAASLLGIHHENRYEGECAIMLENAAWWARTNPGSDEAAEIALSFHLNVAETILSCCEAARRDTGAKQVALSGGVFQNRILMEECLRMLRNAGFRVFYNIAVPPNDGGLALGQNYIGMQYLASNPRPFDPIFNCRRNSPMVRN
jgi:hydrogenase maturation protein HypF